jgi:hypothetical protein
MGLRIDEKAPAAEEMGARTRRRQVLLDSVAATAHAARGELAGVLQGEHLSARDIGIQDAGVNRLRASGIGTRRSGLVLFGLR